jgi:hypothetical protein
MKSIKIVAYYLTTLLLISFFSCLSFSEDIKVQVGEQSAELNNIDRPKAGMSRAKVIEKFGQPLKETPGRGKPPISSLEYENFVVYFETDTVIHSVLKLTQHDSREVHTQEQVEIPESSLKPNVTDEKPKESSNTNK